MSEQTTYIPQIFNKLPRHFPPEKVMADPDVLRMKIEDYFYLLNEEKMLPTPAGLAMAMGLHSFDSILKVLKTAQEDESIYPEESLSVLQYAKSMIEDRYIQLGLQERIPQAFTKFLLSAYFARSERIISEQQGAVDNNFQINVLGVSSPMPAVSGTTRQVIERQQTETTLEDL